MSDLKTGRIRIGTQSVYNFDGEFLSEEYDCLHWLGTILVFEFFYACRWKHPAVWKS
jgi:hypothetical protein